MSDVIVFEDVEVDGHLASVRTEAGRVAAVAGPGSVERAGATIVDGRGGALLPGLHDHHLHLLALAARLEGVDVDRASDAGAFDAAVRAGVPPSTADGLRWLRVGGYDEHRHGPLDRHRLDRLVADGSGRVAVRVQHRSGLSWCLSTAALVAVGVAVERLGPGGESAPAADAPPPDRVGRDADGLPDGWLHRLDAWSGSRWPASVPDLAPVGRRLAVLGLTGVTDATPDLGAVRLAALVEARSAGAVPQRLTLLGADADDLAGLAPEVRDRIAVGPHKLVADEAVGLDLDGLTADVARAHGAGRPVAIHCVTRAEAVVAVAALDAAGPLPGDRLEHGSVLPGDLDPFLASAGVTVVVQPAWVAERGDHYLAAVDDHDRPVLHRGASLLAAGIRVATGSDAPFGTVDPWAAIAAASTRRTRTGALLGPGERVAPAVALSWFLSHAHDPGGSVRTVAPGVAADLCLLDAALADVLAEPDASRVRVTMIDGQVVHGP